MRHLSFAFKSTNRAFALMLAVARRLYAVREARKQPRFYYERFRSFTSGNSAAGATERSEYWKVV
jgi:hypothetical protein